MPINAIVVGKSGQLARALAKRPQLPDWTLRFCDRSEIDLENPHAVQAAIESQRPDIVINAAAYTAVDAAETDEAQATRINGDSPGAMARACANIGAAFVHVSTDYVFDGQSSGRYAVDAPRNPQSAYGRSKALGETQILESGADAAILRTSWVYGAEGANFLRTMLKLAETRDEVSVVHDQTGAPTWSADLADAVMAAARRLAQREAEARGIFHFAGGGETTWAVFAEAIFDEARARGWPAATVKRITTAEFPRPAKRPANSLLDLEPFERAFGLRPRDWRAALRLCMDEIAENRG
ncbi:MAG: dTDP-4-dehydrorhamnose reductase [Hyphomonadaceae bacterium]|nr:dTDP-4-dehydrorhamnose reductase [Hyphomonadaceae bacterium]